MTWASSGCTDFDKPSFVATQDGQAGCGPKLIAMQSVGLPCTVAQPSESFTCSLNSDRLTAVFTSRGMASRTENTPRILPVSDTTGR